MEQVPFARQAGLPCSLEQQAQEYGHILKALVAGPLASEAKMAWPIISLRSALKARDSRLSRLKKTRRHSSSMHASGECYTTPKPAYTT